MKRWLLLSGGFVTAALLTAGLAFGQATTQPKAGADCKKPIDKVEGQVTSVDPNSGKVTVRDKKGQTHEFQASAETLKDMKPGDSIEAKLREAPKC
jgi:hypothetical protein